MKNSIAQTKQVLTIYCLSIAHSAKSGQDADSPIFLGLDTHPMPLTILGSGRSGLANKFGCLVHACKLEISGSESSLQAVGFGQCGCIRAEW